MDSGTKEVHMADTGSNSRMVARGEGVRVERGTKDIYMAATRQNLHMAAGGISRDS